MSLLQWCSACQVRATAAGATEDETGTTRVTDATLQPARRTMDRPQPCSQPTEPQVADALHGHAAYVVHAMQLM